MWKFLFEFYFVPMTHLLDQKHLSEWWETLEKSEIYSQLLAPLKHFKIFYIFFGIRKVENPCRFFILENFFFQKLLRAYFRGEMMLHEKKRQKSRFQRLVYQILKYLAGAFEIENKSLISEEWLSSIRIIIFSQNNKSGFFNCTLF